MFVHITTNNLDSRVLKYKTMSYFLPNLKLFLEHLLN